MSESAEDRTPEWFDEEAPPNPVSRLLALLERLGDHSNPSKVSVVWTRTFGLRPGEEPYLVVGKTLQLVDQARATVEEHAEEGNRSLYLDPFDHLDRVLASMNLKANPGPFLEGIQAATMSLRFCADMVDAATERDRVNTELARELWEDINSLLQTVLESELPEPLKGILYDRLWAVRHALEHFRLVGLEDLEESLDGVIGALVRGREVLTDSKFKGILKRFERVVELGLDVLQTAGKAKQLAAPLLKLIGPSD